MLERAELHRDDQKRVQNCMLERNEEIEVTSQDHYIQSYKKKKMISSQWSKYGNFVHFIIIVISAMPKI
jgi:hypothetical protein